jgi:hypothetical protein
LARAKRTDRAEARRRYRAQLAAEGGGEELDPANDAEPTETRGSATPPPRRVAASAPPAPARPGIAYAFRAAFRPANFREDIAALPQLIRHRSVWLPVLISVGTTAVLLVTGGRDVISALIYQYFIVTPPIGAIFLSGFLAPRASYLTGAIAGLVGAVCLAILVAASSTGTLGGGLGAPGASPSPVASASPGSSASPATSASAIASPAPSGSPAPSAAGSAQPSPTPSGTPATPTPKELADTVAISFLLSPLTGAFFGAAAAWYRRFLNLANPNRGTRRQPAKGKPRRR